MAYSWKFFRAGGFDQVKLETGADLANLDQLDQKLWVALACPTRGLEFDSRTLDLIDTDKDGRVRAPEVIAAAKWTTGLLKTPDELLKGAASLPLDAINDATPEGKQILASAREILRNLGKADAKAIDLADTADTAKIFAATNFNGDGIIPAAAAESEATRAVIAEIISIYGADTDRSGQPGISQTKADAFFAEAKAYADWWKQASGDQTILPLGEATAAAAAAVAAVQTKVDDFFARCQLATFDARAIPALNREEREYFAMTVKELHLGSAEIVSLPLAQIAPGKALPLAVGLNPAWVAALATLQTAAITPLLGARTELTEADWTALKNRLAPFAAWVTGKVGAKVEALGLPRIHEILAGPAQVEINILIAKDKALEPEANAIAVVEKLIRFNRDLYTLATNFVNFKNFYSRTTPAIFQAGRLYLDQRSCDLCLTVEDAGRHAVMAGLAGAYLAYCDCVRKSTGEKLGIVAIFSQGEDDNLMVGRNGVFYDRKGNDYDATITKIVASPISLRQAFWAPYKKLVRMIEEQIAKRAAAADDDVNANLATTAGAAAGTAAPAKKSAFDPSVIALISVALGSISAAFASVLVYLGKFESWQIPFVFGCIMLAISGPSIVLAFIKLRKRNLGPILDANGWAVNAKAKINVPFGTSLTGIAKLPPGATIDISDRYAEKSVAWPKFVVIAFFVWWIWAFLNDKDARLYHWTGGVYGSPPAEVQTELDKQRLNKQKDKVANGAVVTATNAPAVTNSPAAGK